MPNTNTAIPAGTWIVDPRHSSVTFAAKHLGIATIRGQFRRFEGRIEADGDGYRAAGSVDVASLDTNQAKRDEHLRSPDFFAVEQFPRISFTATGIRPLADGRLEVSGDLTIRDVTRTLTLTGTVHGREIDPRGNEERLALELAGTVDRRDFDMRFNPLMLDGRLVISNEVEFRFDISAINES